MTKKPVLVWFRNDLRLEDNPALDAARKSGAPVIGVYVLDDALPYAPGAAARWWLHHSLRALAADLEKAGTKLILRRGDTTKTVGRVVKETCAGAVFWNRRYYAKHTAIDDRLEAALKSDGVRVAHFNASLLREPWETQTKSGAPYRVFTPFWNALKGLGPSRPSPFPRPRKLAGPASYPESDRLDDWALSPSKPNWAQEIAQNWTPGEKGARQRLDLFLHTMIDHYTDKRDRPDLDIVSRLSPHLAFGEIGPLQIWRETQAMFDGQALEHKGAEKYLSEIAWREFCYSLLYYHKELPETPWKPAFEKFAWRSDEQALEEWRHGLTGYPIVDAGMRQLWRTGWMHNRVRMIVASFLVKDHLISWQDGAAWFWDTLVDADLANNAASWQWVAGCGADAAPYFRIFNPVTQGERYDPDGDYILTFVPELRGLPARYLHKPWAAPEDVREKAGVHLGKTYPKPNIEHAGARKRALREYGKIKSG